jgi:exonuclease III
VRVVSWNLNHRTIEKPIPSEAIKFFEAFDSDLIILNEFVDGESRLAFRAELDEIGYKHQLISSKIGKQNQVFIASKTEISRGNLNSPQQDDAAKTNFLHVSIDGTNIEIVGFRAPAYKSFKERQTYWVELAAIMESVASRQHFLVLLH